MNAKDIIGMLNAGTPFPEIETKLKGGCVCCGWHGDIYLYIRRVTGRGDFVVIRAVPGQEPRVLYYSTAYQLFDPNNCDHRVIDYFSLTYHASMNKNIDEILAETELHNNKVADAQQHKLDEAAGEQVESVLTELTRKKKK